MIPANVTVVSNPIVDDALSHIRSKDTGVQQFRYFSERLCRQLISNSILKKDTSSVDIETPIKLTTGRQITDNFVVVVILRSGIAMLPSVLDMLPDASVGYAGIYRDEKNATAHEYYWKLPPITSKDTILIVDPMLATGGTILHVIKRIIPENPKEIRIISVVSTIFGIKKIQKSYSDVKFIVASIDQGLNDKKYIVPGLGDFGDRYFGTTT